jgi:acetyl esterase/lipase
VVVCPGGGYVCHADHEAEPVAEWLCGLGVAGFVLRYRLGPRYTHPAPLEDADRAVRWVRSRAEEWGVDPGRIGILGFSAGGHLAATLSTHFAPGDPWSPDPVLRASSRPSFQVLIYPVVSLVAHAHAGSVRTLLGESPDPALVEDLSAELRVDRGTPPAFLVHTVEDSGVPAEHSTMMAFALRAAGVRYELHVFDRGQHGFGLGGDDPALSAWPRLCEAWMRKRGLLPSHG